MSTALALARRGLGRVWPNPSVGCVVVSAAGRVLGRGWTQPGGRPHGETEALARAGTTARGGTAYVSLEPCNHWGKTPPCTEALRDAGVARVVVALDDPDPRVSGSGVARLRSFGMAVDSGLGADEAAEINAGFLLRIREGRPLVALKAATSIDGRIATSTGESQWITGPSARRQGHMLRAAYDGIMVGIRTALRDDPALTCRLAGLEDRSPVRIVVDARLELPPQSTLVATAGTVPTWVVCLASADGARANRLADAGVGLVPVPEGETGEPGRPDMRAALQALGARGLTRLLVEGGGILAASLLRADLVDRLLWFRAPSLLGGAGLPAVAGLGRDRLADAPRFERLSIADAGGDVLETYSRRR